MVITAVAVMQVRRRGRQDSEEFDAGYSYNMRGTRESSQSSVFCIVQLNVGDTVWVRPGQILSTYDEYFSAFTGFLQSVEIP
jgi:hypothetical protein